MFGIFLNSLVFTLFVRTRKKSEQVLGTKKRDYLLFIITVIPDVAATGAVTVTVTIACT